VDRKKIELARRSWRYLRGHSHHRQIQAFVDSTIEAGLDQVLFAHTSLAALVVTTEHRWDASGPSVSVRPTVGGFRLKGVDPDSGEETECEVNSTAEAVEAYRNLLRHLIHRPNLGS
jgi:hypothetical protein